MKKYTIIYLQNMTIGNRTVSTIEMRHIECKQKDLKASIEKFVDVDEVSYIFSGHCKSIR